jgi:hypothetical protein
MLLGCKVKETTTGNIGMARSTSHLRLIVNVQQLNYIDILLLEYG